MNSSGLQAAPGPLAKRAPSCTTGQRALRPVVCQSSIKPQQQEQSQPACRRQMLASMAVALAAGLSIVGPARAEGPFLTKAGGRGILAQEEEALYRQIPVLRAAIIEEEQVIERETKASQEGKFCATPFGIDIVGISEAILLVGALTGGVVARQRKEELQRLNEQLRKINLSLRQQARAGTVYAPGLTYAPPVGDASIPAAPPASRQLSPKLPSGISAGTATLAQPIAHTAQQPASIISMEDEDMTPDQIQCRDALRQGKRLLKERNGAGALVRFEKSLMLSKALADKVMERRAMRGLAAAARLQGQFKTSIKHLERVLEISKEMKEYTGDSDAYGTIADCYTDMGDLEKAAFFYDKYIDAMNSANA